MKWLIVLLAALCFAACSDDTEDKDTGSDVTIYDASQEAVVDAAEETTSDVGVDVKDDVVVDSASDDQGDDQ